eukprot:TRINITY_DN32733_c0_g1_i1.p2 TRINITY_DN32733_c0_g1~~TRINITY_DN32733_c0_g1_i1.p2  ORF type:complete len:219 (+),score=55.69 TRINITY_DN32733_c0_g1_i1:69-725(+)
MVRAGRRGAPQVPTEDAVFACAERGDIHGVLRLLLEDGGRDVDAHWDPQGATVLARAAGAGQLPLVNELLARGAAADAVDTVGVRPLARAAAGGHGGVVAALLREGAQVNAACQDLGDTALHSCIRHRATARDAAGTVECALRLVAAGADAAQFNRLALTPLALLDSTPPSEADPELRRLLRGEACDGQQHPGVTQTRMVGCSRQGCTAAARAACCVA